MKSLKLRYPTSNLALWLSIGLLLNGCANMQSLDAATQQRSSNQSVHANSTSSATTVKSKLMTVFKRYEGTPYVYGGADGRGFDCSGFINVAFDEAFNLSLPRTTEALVTSGKPVTRNQLAAGDIVFFKTSAKDLHAGIYSANSQFIHSSTSKGVIQSSLENDYWKNRYVSARRIL